METGAGSGQSSVVKRRVGMGLSSHHYDLQSVKPIHLVGGSAVSRRVSGPKSKMIS